MTHRVELRRAFTLVELLVVIGIIAVLIAILLPTIAGANRAAKTTACAANLRSLGQALTGYANEFKIYPYGYYLANIGSPGGVGAAGDEDPNKNAYVWWSIIRGYMRGKGAPMDNSILADNGGTLTRFMAAFNCPMGQDREAGCDFVCNASVMIQRERETGGLVAHPQAKNRNARPQKPTSVYPDTILLWDAPEIAPAFNTQYLISYVVDSGPGSPQEIGGSGLLANPRKVSWRYRNVDSPDRRNDAKHLGENNPIYTGLNEDVTGSNASKMAGGIRFRHGRNDTANFLFADGSVKSFTTTKNWATTPRGELLRKYFRSKLPAGYVAIDAPN